MQAISNILPDTNSSNRSNRDKVIKPIGAIGREPRRAVDHLLYEYRELIDPQYTKWFAKRFYILPFDGIHRAASEARQDGNNSQKLFAFIINKMYNSVGNKDQ